MKYINSCWKEGREGARKVGREREGRKERRKGREEGIFGKEERRRN